MTATTTQSITLSEFLQLPETKPAREYINGEIIQKPILVFLTQQQPVLLQGEESLPALSEIELTLTVNQVFSWLKMN
ncbi:MAG: hypothetical protein RID53_03140 [Coleofasciculus sp. B1-GNL1-01]|uniref:hypothetical protein n=1 Tax=Coleofasciculus sp. B1-GNL1-01 TaxID=3068484 RepID=UPI0032F3A1C9